MPRRGHISLDPTTRIATSWLNPGVWRSYDEALAVANGEGSADGVGFSLTNNDPYFFIDIDDCFVNGQWTPFAIEICQRFDGAWIECSHSGTGLHIYGRSSSIPPHCCKNADLNFELYTHSKFVHVTHIHPRGDGETDHTASLLWLIETHFPARADFDTDEWSEGPRADWDGITSDDELISAAFSAKGAAATFGVKASFGDLWEAREDRLGVFYPDASRPYGASEADAALAQHLAFWTGCDCNRIDRLMRQSKLHRSKWDDRGDYYLPRTILNACAMQEDVYKKAVVETPVNQSPANTDPDKDIPPPTLCEGYQFLQSSQLIEYFKGCTYVINSHKMLVPGGRMVDAARFNALYGGYVFALDTIGEKTTDVAFKAYTESRVSRFPKVDSAAFRPELEPGALFNSEGTSHVNTYWPTEVKSEPGDVTPFLSHLTKVLPNEQDSQTLLAYMAACIQHKGVKFQWCPLLQGAEGNGKTLFSRVVAAAIGKKHSHFPKASQIDSEFNGWIFNNIFIGVEDIYVSEKKSHVMEILKPLITGEFQEVRQMYADGDCKDICCNFILNSNHKDALRKTRNDRRFAIFYSAQQSADDITRDGMGGEYFSNLYDWLNNGGYAMTTHYLQTYEIPDELNPARGCQRAPVTSSTEEALNASMGSVEQAIIEAVEEERQGFAGGWISSIALGELLENIRATRQIPANKRRDLLQTIGYDWHPGLPDGRVSMPSDIDGMNRPKLFVKKGSPLERITGPAEIFRLYRDAQNRNPFAMHDAANATEGK